MNPNNQPTLVNGPANGGMQESFEGLALQLCWECMADKQEEVTVAGSLAPHKCTSLPLSLVDVRVNDVIGATHGDCTRAPPRQS